MNNIYNKNNTCAIIPFYNEVNSIDKIIDETLEYCSYVFTVNDGSTDGSENRIRLKNNVKIILHKKNIGKGKALRSGFEEAIKSNFKFVVTLDADLQHSPKCIPELINNLSNNDFVIGNRLDDLNNMPLQRIMSNRMTSFLLSQKTRCKILDSQSGFRAFRIEALRKILPSKNGFEAESEMIVLAARNHLRIGFTSIPTIYGDEKSKMKSIQAIVGFIKVLFM